MGDKPSSTNTSHLARALAQSEIGKTVGLTVNKSLAVIEQLGGLIVEQLAAGSTVHWHKFGNFKVLDTKARKGRNPRTGEDIQIPAGKRAHFVVSAHMKEAVGTGKVPTAKPKKSAAAKTAAASKGKGGKGGGAGAGFKPGKGDQSKEI